ncbi:EamA family transporter [Clavibacter michiganensis]|uniref:Putative DMT superfamily transporter inner membrane protein n=1 Tax=Clavibacter michiganensis TaxID=28447 RepID=A0A251YNW5_9MICO|nr:EamA family transporter [Clavibacter michiganensis]OUE25931.1 putative DMT superfamily transporter inner membrane protein [Clavibacter michiganensis]
MLSHPRRLVIVTAVAPVLWGTTYVTSTAFLVADHPLLTATLRALPAGLLLLALGRELPRGAWWWRSGVLGALNIGAFFAFLFIAADRLPGGVAAVIGGIQPLLVSALAARILGERMPLRVMAAGIVGLAGVALIVLRADARLDAVGIVAALAGAFCMAVGVVLAKRWGPDHPPLVTTSWQLLAGGILLAALTATLEPLPVAPLTAVNVAGYAYLALVGTAVAYLLWFRGVRALPARVPAFLGLLSPVVAVTIGLCWSGETLTASQAVGMALVLVSVGASVAVRTTQPRVPRPEGGGADPFAPGRMSR